MAAVFPYCHLVISVAPIWARVTREKERNRAQMARVLVVSVIFTFLQHEIGAFCAIVQGGKDKLLLKCVEEKGAEEMPRAETSTPRLENRRGILRCAQDDDIVLIGTEAAVG